MAKDTRSSTTQAAPEVTGPIAGDAVSPAAPPASPNLPAPAATGPALKRFLVSLPRHKSLMKDPHDPDKNILVDKLPIDAETPGDAIQRFNEMNGITATIHKHVVEAA